MQDTCARFDPIILSFLGAWLLYRMTIILSEVCPMEEPTRDPEYVEFIGDD